jgi:hypothetical protein
MEDDGTATAAVQAKEGGGIASRVASSSSIACCGPLEQVGRCILFLALCFVLFIMGLLKGAIVGPPSALIMFVGDMAVVIGLWPVHVFCTYRTIAMYDDVSPLLFAC